jgi:hypothetical protein
VAPGVVHPRGRVVLGPRPPSGSVADQASGGPPSDDSRRLRQFHYDCAETFSQTENLTGTIDQLCSVRMLQRTLPAGFIARSVVLFTALPILGGCTREEATARIREELQPENLEIIRARFRCRSPDLHFFGYRFRIYKGEYAYGDICWDVSAAGEAVGAILTIQVRPNDFCPPSVVG